MEKYIFVPEDITRAIAYNYYDFGIDTTLEQWDHKRGNYIIELDLSIKAGDLVKSTFDFSQFSMSLETSSGKLDLN